MDELDVALVDAWNRVSARCRGDRVEAWKRSGRRLREVLMRPPAAWCLRLRASDTRLEREGYCWREWVEADTLGAREHRRVQDSLTPALSQEERGSETRDCAEPPFDGAQGRSSRLGGHDVTVVPGGTIRELCAPVDLRYPGVALWEAAKMLGRTREAMREWLPRRQGRTKVQKAGCEVRRYEEYEPRLEPLWVEYVPAQSRGHFGHDVPMVWAKGLLDPGASRGATPHAMWGSLWRNLSGQIPEGYVLRAERVERWRLYKGVLRQRGWDWICPGRWKVLMNGEKVLGPCGRRCHTLYGPLPVMSVGKFLGDEEGFEVQSPELNIERPTSNIQRSMPELGVGRWTLNVGRSRLQIAGRWYPGWHDPWAGLRGFACRRCWGVRSGNLMDRNGWNEFVTHVSGGLLYGREVERPEWVRYRRKIGFEKRGGGKKIEETPTGLHGDSSIRGLPSTGLRAGTMGLGG